MLQCFSREIEQLMGKESLKCDFFILDPASNKVPIQAGIKILRHRFSPHLFLFLVYCWCDAAIINLLLLPTSETCFIPI